MDETAIHSSSELLSLLSKSRGVSAHSLGDILTQEHKLDRSDLESALAQQVKEPGKRLGEILIEQGTVSREIIRSALARKLGIPSVSLERFDIEPRILEMIPPDIALNHWVLPLLVHHNRLIVAMADPLDWETMELLRFHTNHNIEVVHTSTLEISLALDKYYSQHAEDELQEMADKLELAPAGQTRLSRKEQSLIQQMAQEAQKKPIVRLVNAIILRGIMLRASDINIRPGKERISIYYRVDGRLQQARTLSKALLAPLVSRIKITGRMDIAERRLPQDGHSRLIHEGRQIDLRISVVPTVSGESVVIRILNPEVGLKPLNLLGLGERDYRTLLNILSHNNGIFLVTGPTGSGKSTTLYALLNQIRKGEPHIITVEDPVEYAMDGIEQIQINPVTGYTFAEALRHILRHDPDVVMVGEIRDMETARIANRAALTGHLVLSTLHTNDAASTITRLLDMGVEPYLLSTTLRGVMAQRLVRLNCPHCKQPEPVPTEQLRRLGLDEDETFYKGTGCEACNQSGYHGRAVVVELLEVTTGLGELIAAGANSQQMRKTAVQQGMLPLTHNALRMAREGKTSLEEVFAVRLD